MNRKSYLINELHKYGEPTECLGFSIVTIHPLADEIELLKKLNMESKDCVLCDFYWLYSEQLIFVSVNYSAKVEPSVSYFKKDAVDNGHSFNVYTSRKQISLEVVEMVLRFLDGWVSEHQFNFQEQPHSVIPKIIKDGDICLNQ